MVVPDGGKASSTPSRSSTIASSGDMDVSTLLKLLSLPGWLRKCSKAAQLKYLQYCLDKWDPPHDQQESDPSYLLTVLRLSQSHTTRVWRTGPWALHYQAGFSKRSRMYRGHLTPPLRDGE